MRPVVIIPIVLTANSFAVRPLWNKPECRKWDPLAKPRAPSKRGAGERRNVNHSAKLLPVMSAFHPEPKIGPASSQRSLLAHKADARFGRTTPSGDDSLRTLGIAPYESKA
jgi:hypothetical protein